MKQRKNPLALGVPLALLFSLGSLAQAQIYDATADFNPGTYASNPNGVWRYGYTTTLGGSFIQHTDSGSNAPGIQYWQTDLDSSVPRFMKNTTGSTVNGMLPGQVALHGGPSNTLAVLRFTTPIMGTYNISTAYFEGHYGDTDIYLLHNGATLASSPSTNAGGTFSLNSLFLNANDTVDVVVGNGSDGYFGDTTPINHTITLASTSAPEPGTLGLLALGITAGIAVRRRKGQNQ